MKKLLKQKLRKVLYYIHHVKHEKFYKLVMQMNGIKNCKASREDKWIEKWSQLGVKASPTQYHVFSKYIGNNINIVPEDICHDFIEPVLNPLRFVGYYSDKNMFDKIFPSGYCPKTILRKIRGHWYSADYNELRLTDATFIQILGGLSCQKLIIKPSVDGISGIGVRLYSRIGGDCPKT